MITTLPAQWLLTAAFLVAGSCAALSRRESRVPAAYCIAMCAALIAMTWRSEPAAALWTQAAAFGCAGLWFGLRRQPLHALMALAMVWMLAAMADMAGPGTAGMAPARAMTGMSGAGLPAPLLAGCVVLGVACALACVPWLVRAVASGPRCPRIKNPLAAGQAAMSAGMAAMLFAAL